MTSKSSFLVHLFSCLVALVLCGIALGGQPKIAIIGGGIGGTSTAYFIRELLGDDVTIVLYEAADQLGGRVATAEIGGNHYETGASILHPKNMYAVRLAEKFGLRPRSQVMGNRLALFDGREFVWEESEYGEIMTMLSAFYRYRFDLIRHKRFVEKLLGSFLRIYELQDSGKSFESLYGMLRAMDEKFVDLMKKSLREELVDGGFSERFIAELARAMTLCNYGQGESVHAMVGSVALAAASNGIWAIEGGNKRLVQEMATASRANVHLGLKVKKVSLTSDNKYLVFSANGAAAEEYDALVIAAPLVMSDIQLDGFPFDASEITKDIKYQRTVATMVEGITVPQFSSFDTIACNESLPFRSIASQPPVLNPKSITDEMTRVHKVFSDHVLDEREMSAIFERRKSVLHVDWLAYPNYESMRGVSQAAGKFLLHPGLVYVSPIELAASCMEMSMIGGRNAAMLVSEYLKPAAVKKSGSREQQHFHDVQDQKVEL